MNTDVALNYKALLIEIENKIKEIKNIGFDISKLKEELDNIKLNNSNNVRESKKKSFDGFLASDYINAINNLNKLQTKLDEYNIYIKIYYYNKYLNKLDLTKENINEIISEIKVLLKGIRNSSIMDYEDEKHLIESFYKMIFKVIYKEIYYYQKSDLLDYCKLDSVDSSFIANIVEEYLKEINLINYNDIELNYYNIKKNGNLSDILDLEFIKSIVFRDEKEKIEENLKVRYGEIVSEVNESNDKIINIMNYRDELENTIRKEKINCKDDIKKIMKGILSIIVSISINVGTFTIFLKAFKRSYSNYSYDSKTELYNSLSNSVDISKGKIIVKNDDLNDLEESNVYLIKYEILSDDEAKKESKTSNRFSDYEELEAKYKLRKILKYDLSFLGYDDINKYMDYVKLDETLPKPDEEICDISLDNKNYIDLVDYYEIIYKFVDLDSKEYVDYDKESAISMALILELAMFILSSVSILPTSIKSLLSNDFFYNRKKVEAGYKEFLKNTKILFDEIGKNETLRKTFNIEMAKHKKIFVEAGLVLPNEVISEEEKVKLLSKGNVRK